MIKFTYDNFKEIGFENIPVDTLRPASDYCIPDQILSALRHIIPSIKNHLANYNQEVKEKTVPALVSNSKFPGRKVSLPETFRITQFGLRSIDPTFEKFLGLA